MIKDEEQLDKEIKKYENFLDMDYEHYIMAYPGQDMDPKKPVNAELFSKEDMKIVIKYLKMCKTYVEFNNKKEVK